jgi:hypothetical protein
MSKVSRGEVQLLSRLIMGGSVLSAITGFTATPRQPPDLIISNVSVEADLQDMGTAPI